VKLSKKEPSVSWTLQEKRKQLQLAMGILRSYDVTTFITASVFIARLR
jgi:hypothetical protein